MPLVALAYQPVVLQAREAPVPPPPSDRISLQFVETHKYPEPPDYQAIRAANDKRIADEIAEKARQAAVEAARKAEEDRLAQLAAQVPITAYTPPTNVVYGNNYTAGQCTAWVASQTNVPASMGNATNWSGGLLSAGWRYDLQPGSVGVGHVGIGHVVFVEAVTGQGVQISEMNYAGPFIVTRRTVSVSEYEWFHR